DRIRYPLDGAAETFRVLRGGVKHALELESPAAIETATQAGPDGTRAVLGFLALDAGVTLVPRGGGGDGGFVTGSSIDVVGRLGNLFVLPAPRAFDAKRAAIGGRWRWNPRDGIL